MKTFSKSILAGIAMTLAAGFASAQSSAENDYQRARSEARAREAKKEQSLLGQLRTSIIPQFAKMSGMTAAKVDTPKLFSSTYFSHMTATDGRACEVQINTSYRALEFEDLSDIKSFFRPARAKVLATLCGRERSKKFVQHSGEVLQILIDYAQSSGTDSEDYQKLERLTIASLNLGLNVYQNDCQLEPWTITATCLSGRGEKTFSRELMKSPKGILFDR